MGVEGLQSLDRFAHADGMDGQGEFFSDGDENAAARGAVQLGHDDAGHPGDVAKRLRLENSVLPGGGIENEQHRMRCAGVAFLNDAHDFCQFLPGIGLVLPPSGGVDGQQVGVLFLRALRRV